MIEDNPTSTQPSAATLTYRFNEEIPRAEGSAQSEDGDPGAEEQWPGHTGGAGVRLRLPAAVLFVILVAAGGIWGGAALQRSHGTSSSSATGGLTGTSPFARGTGRTGSGTTGIAGPGTASAATGTVTVIDGNTIFVTTSSGGLVKVVVASSTKISRNASTVLSELKPGDTITVQGTKSKSGAVRATSIASTQAGLSTTPTGFP